MRSSRSTPSRSPDAPIALFLRHADEDHPKACTGRRLLARGWASSSVPPGRRPLVLDPRASRPLSASDASLARREGLLAVDCSWNRIAQRGSLPPGSAGDPARRRRLPLLVAANPQHFGRLAELNTVEALSAGLYVLGFPEAAARILEGFRGGPEFLVVNASRLRAYAAATGFAEVVTAERREFRGPG